MKALPLRLLCFKVCLCLGQKPAPGVDADQMNYSSFVLVLAHVGSVCQVWVFGRFNMFCPLVKLAGDLASYCIQTLPC